MNRIDLHAKYMYINLHEGKDRQKKNNLQLVLVNKYRYLKYKCFDVNWMFDVYFAPEYHKIKYAVFGKKI